MSNVTMTGNSTERCLLDMPYEIVFEIFRRLPKGKLIKVSKLSSKLRDIAGDTRVWKDVCIEYEPNEKQRNVIFAFEELYLEPWPVKAIDLSCAKIESPVSLDTDQLVKVTELDLSSTKADTVTIEAILAKYQCTKLFLAFEWIDCYGHVMGIAPAALLKQTDLEVLSLGFEQLVFHDMGTHYKTLPYFHHWLTQVLTYYCNNLKTLDLSMPLANSVLSSFVEILPTSLEKLLLPDPWECLEESFFKLLAGSCPNLRELVLCPSSVKYPSILKFQFLKTLRISAWCCEDTSDLYMYLLKFPALKTVYIYEQQFIEDANYEMLLSTLKPHCIAVEIRVEPRRPTRPANCYLWKVTKAV